MLQNRQGMLYMHNIMFEYKKVSMIEGGIYQRSEDKRLAQLKINNDLYNNDSTS
ncbi:hypothetical protein M2387_001005 [Klebsiella sp. BIGb0407]|nr:hypothetical protein [Klebsiella sp. BIGb0407]